MEAAKNGSFAASAVVEIPMKLTFDHHGFRCSCETNEAKSIAVKMDFEGAQPNHFGTEKASTTVLKLGGFNGDTATGGSCNVKILKLIPHCNGTHTETVSHIVNEDIWIGHAAMGVMGVAMLITVEPVEAKNSKDTYRPALAEKDKLVTASQIEAAVAKVGDVEKLKPDALIVRTSPNPVDKCSWAYSEKNYPAFLSIEAIKEVNKIGVRHLLLDLPSVDRMYDDGLLTNHHLFWNVAENSHELGAATAQDKTITEMIFVDDEIADGVYAVNIQVPAFCSDAAPSRPIIMPLKMTTLGK